MNKLLYVLKTLSPFSLVRQVSHFAVDVYYDYLYGISTHSWAIFPALFHEGQGCHPYEPTTYLDFKRAMEHLLPFSGEDVFLDLGCGKGRALVLASMYPYKEIIGLEISERLARSARETLERSLAPGLCQNHHVIVSDAADFAIPSRVTMIFLFNPFGSQLLTRVFYHIKNSLLQAPRKLRIIFANPMDFEETLRSYDWLRVKYTFQGYRRHLILESLHENKLHDDNDTEDHH
jgi:cyclopropane fatty-acyl-phospholipid synthase-like methyltransferase